jgi:hypothetical protein
MSGILVLTLRVVMAVCLYCFLGFVIYLIWKDLRQKADVAAKVRVPLLTLQVDEAVETPVVQIHSPEAFIGRDPGCEVFVKEGTLSARHARLSYHHKQWWLEDLHSTNGTRLNDQPVHQPVVIDSGDKVSCGSVRFLIRVDSAGE